MDRPPIDPLLPASCPVDISPSMHREIMNDLPMRLVKPKYSTDARRQLVKYAEAARRMIESRGTSLESRKVVKWHAEDALEWLRKQRNASYEDLLVSFALLIIIISVVLMWAPTDVELAGILAVDIAVSPVSAATTLNFCN